MRNKKEQLPVVLSKTENGSNVSHKDFFLFMSISILRYWHFQNFLTSGKEKIKQQHQESVRLLFKWVCGLYCNFTQHMHNVLIKSNGK